MKQVVALVLILSTLLISACGGSRKNDPIVVSQESLDTALEQAVDNSIIAAADNFAEQAVGLSAKTSTFCSAPGTATLSAAQTQWKLALEYWYRLEPYNFGPLNDDIVFPAYNYIDSLRLRGTDYTDTVRTDIDTMIAGSNPLSSSYFASKNFNQMGLLAIEAALFETAATQSRTLTDILNEFASTPRKCDILQGYTTQLAKRALYVEQGWRHQHKGSTSPYRELFLSNQLDDGAAPLTQLLAAIQEHLDYLQQRHVASVAAQISGHGWQAVNASIDEIEALLEGKDSTSTSFFDIMIASGYEASVETVRANIQFARDSIALQDAVQFEVAAAQLDGNFKREIPNGLEVELGINFTDGD